MGETRDTATKDEWCASFEGRFHDLRDEASHPALHPAPSTGYPAGQGLASQLLSEGAVGLIYPSVRSVGDTNLVCFRPALVINPQRGATITFSWDGGPEPTITGMP